MKEILGKKDIWQPIGPYSNAVKKGNMIFISGTVGVDKDGKIAGNDIKSQTRQTFENIKKLLNEAGATMEDVMKVTVFLKNTKDYKGMNEVRREYFPNGGTASTAVTIADLMLPELLLEIEAIAVKD